MKNPSINQAVITKNQNQILVEGPLTQETVVSAYAACVNLFVAQQACEINLAAVTDCDSAGLACIIELLREAKAQQIQLQFNYAPQQMRDLSLVNGLDPILNLN